VFSDRASQLGHLDLSLVIPLEASEHDLPLAWLQSVHHAGDRTLVVHVREENQLLVDEVRVRDGTGGLPVEE
jgi:prephenate dehydrogenase